MAKNKKPAKRHKTQLDKIDALLHQLRQLEKIDTPTLEQRRRLHDIANRIGKLQGEHDTLQLIREANTDMLDAAQIRDLMIGCHASYNAIKAGKGEEHDAHQLAITSNIALVLCELGAGAEFQDDVITAQAHVWQLQLRLAAGQPMLLTGPGMAAVERLLELHDAQLPHLTVGQMAKAVRIVHERARGGHVYTIETAQEGITEEEKTA